MNNELRYSASSVLVGRVLLLVTLLWLSWSSLTLNIIRLGFEPGVMHGIHLVFHEAGHVIFALFGTLVMTMGGTIMQLLAPIVIGASLVAKNRDYFGGLIGGWWLGHSMIDCAPYINDARVLQLPLLGGGTGADREGHDWEYILTRLDILSHDIYIARAFLYLGRILVVGCLLAAVVLALMTYLTTRDEGAISQAPRDAA